MTPSNDVAVVVRKLMRDLQEMQNNYSELKQLFLSRPRTITEEIDTIPGRRLAYTLSSTQLFTTANDGLRGQPITMQVSQDGPFIMTHYPLVVWKSSAPSNATDFGMWRPVATWPLPTQEVDTNVIDISYELTDGGPGRNLQNSAIPAGLLSRPDNMIPLPVPTLFAPNATIQFTPTYENIVFSGSTATTQGTLVVALPGYRIVNM